MMHTTRTLPLEVLVVEDNPAHVRLLSEALRDSTLRVHMRVARDGVEALEFLDPHTAADPSPDLILLDLNLPRKDGREVLQEIKADRQLKQIPVLVLTTSHAEEDVQSSYALGANAVVRKPVDFDQFTEVVHAIDLFWFKAATLMRPTDGDASLPT